jgi:hypothetical protein
MFLDQEVYDTESRDMINTIK